MEMSFFRIIKNLFHKKETVEKPVEEIKVVEYTYAKITNEHKEILTNIIRPIVKSYNTERKDEYLSICNLKEDDVKALKTYAKIVDEDTLLIFKFTQSDDYNKKIQPLVEKIFEEFINTCKDEIDYPKEFEIEDGKIKLRLIDQFN